MLKQEVEKETHHLRRRLDNFVTNEIGHMTKSKRDHIVDSWQHRVKKLAI